jgi:serine/threonine protein phosphatase PrpC
VNSELPIWLSLATAQIQGQRERQEDSFLCRFVQAGLITVLGDGLGGHPRGDEASDIACHTAAVAIEEALNSPMRDVTPALRDSIVVAHKAVRTIRAGSWPPPATTLIAGVFLPAIRQFHAANVGDSLCYRLRNERLQRLFKQLTDDEGLMYSVGHRIEDEDGSKIQLLDPPLDLQPGDRFLLASDGIEVVDDEDIRTRLALATAREGCEALVRLLLDRRLQYQDNLTLMLVKVEGAVATGTVA